MHVSADPAAWAGGATSVLPLTAAAAASRPASAVLVVVLGNERGEPLLRPCCMEQVPFEGGSREQLRNRRKRRGVVAGERAAMSRTGDRARRPTDAPWPVRAVGVDRTDERGA